MEELQKFESIGQVVAKNKPMIAEKIKKAIDALTLIQVVETPEQDEFANQVLVKCNATLPVVEGLRKEYTSIIDEWKKSEMALESSLKKEMERVRVQRNEYANRIAKANQEKQKAIEQQKAKDLEIARIKKEMVLAVQFGVSQRIADGENSIAKLFEAMTLENYEAQAKKLNFTPKLKEEVFRGFLAVDYNQELIPYDEFKAIVDKAYEHFNYAKCDKEYVEAVNKVIAKWKAILPAKLKELQATGAEGERLRKESAEKAQKLAQERADKLKAEQEAAQKKAQETQSNEAMDAEFKGQLALQEIAPQEGVRGVISYRLKEDKPPMAIIEAMSRVMVNVFADPAFKGIYKRDKAGIPKRDDKGQPEYIDAIQCWLDLLAKVKPSPEFDGVVKTEDVTSIAKAR